MWKQIKMQQKWEQQTPRESRNRALPFSQEPEEEGTVMAPFYRQGGWGTEEVISKCYPVAVRVPRQVLEPLRPRQACFLILIQTVLWGGGGTAVHSVRRQTIALSSECLVGDDESGSSWWEAPEPGRMGYYNRKLESFLLMEFLLILSI